MVCEQFRERVVLAKKRSISWTDIASTSVGRMNARKVDELWPTKQASKKSKYGNVKTIVDGIKFDSKGESERYTFLKLKERTGRIKDLRLQVPYELIPKSRNEAGKAIRAMTYKADFVYIDTRTGREVVEDFKGKRTQDYINKSKHMKEKYGIEIHETDRTHLKEGRL